LYLVFEAQPLLVIQIIRADASLQGRDDALPDGLLHPRLLLGATFMHTNFYYATGGSYIETNLRPEIFP
jgi:hypothetical protein